MKIVPEPACIVGVGFTCRVWSVPNFARSWYGDVVREAAIDGVDARRREILFAVAFAECYLLEWVRDEVLKKDFDRLEEFFPQDARRGVREKWVRVPKNLHRAQLIAGVPDLGNSQGEEWNKLVAFRDGLVHASASRPAEHPPGNEPQPAPKMSELNKLAPGWALAVVREQIRRLNIAAGLPVPTWLAAQRHGQEALGA